MKHYRHAHLEGAKERTKIISDALTRIKLPYFVDFEYIERGIATSLGVFPIVIMDWVNAKPLKAYLEDNLYNPDKLKALASNFYTMTQQLHENKISHGDLQHGNIMVKDDGSIVLVDYDSIYVPELDGWTDEINGQPGYQHPSRWNNKLLSPKADYFSEMVIYLSIIALSELPNLWNDLNIKDTDTLLFSADDINSGGTSSIFRTLDSIDECSDVTEQIKASLRCNCIDDIQPLEVNKTSITEKLSKLWKNNGYEPGPSFDDKDVISVASKW